MFFYEGQTCPVCGQYFGEKDDIVTCPECGAPHHRACWEKEGHCHFEQLHGTDRHWTDAAPSPEAKAEQTAPAHPKRCLRCGYDNPEFSEFCARCGLELKAEDWASASNTSQPPPPVQEERPPVGYYTPPVGGRPPFVGVQQPFTDPYGGVSRTDTIEGVSVDTLVQIIGPNSAYYLPRFKKMAESGRKRSWNWSAFLFGYNWLLYRKTFLIGCIACVVLTALQMVNELLLDKAMLMVGVESAEQLIPYAATLMSSMQGRVLWLLLGLFSAIVLVSQILIGLFGNYLYMKAVLRKAKQWECDPSTAFSQNVFKSGGVSFFTAILPELVISLVTVLILNFQVLFM